MVLGRWLQQRVLDRNRRFLLEDDGSDALLVRRREGGTVAVVPAPQVGSGDALLVAPGDLLVVDATLTQAGLFSLDWITGEPQPRRFAAGETVPAGAFNAGRNAVEARATQSFQQSVLPALLAARPEGEARTGSARFFDALARYYVVTVLALAAVGTLALGARRDAPRGGRRGRPAGRHLPLRARHRHPARATSWSTPGCGGRASWSAHRTCSTGSPASGPSSSTRPAR